MNRHPNDGDQETGSDLRTVGRDRHGRRVDGRRRIRAARLVPFPPVVIAAALTAPVCVPTVPTARQYPPANPDTRMRLNLTGATLIDFDLASGHVTQANFDKATFIGEADFDEATFSEDANFDGAAFTEGVGFGAATFTGDVGLGGAVVVNPAAQHVWPEGWRLETTPEGTAHLAREETDGGPATGSLTGSGGPTAVP
ncbi:pentapeptide repeat-containing protein [Streptosporangium sandarakinum]|uniref:pentapeptide repeat-containing protein n=1 Tax=Streptosporangium sandarakinum TaxID=1260955 RepID=UPI00371F6623